MDNYSSKATYTRKADVKISRPRHIKWTNYAWLHSLLSALSGDENLIASVSHFQDVFCHLSVSAQPFEYERSSSFHSFIVYKQFKLSNRCDCTVAMHESIHVLFMVLPRRSFKISFIVWRKQLNIRFFYKTKDSDPRFCSRTKKESCMPSTHNKHVIGPTFYCFCYVILCLWAHRSKHNKGIRKHAIKDYV